MGRRVLSDQRRRWSLRVGLALALSVTQLVVLHAQPKTEESSVEEPKAEPAAHEQKGAPETAARALDEQEEPPPIWAPMRRETALSDEPERRLFQLSALLRVGGHHEALARLETYWRALAQETTSGTVKSRRRWLIAYLSRLEPQPQSRYRVLLARAFLLSGYLAEAAELLKAESPPLLEPAWQRLRLQLSVTRGDRAAIIREARATRTLAEGRPSLAALSRLSLARALMMTPKEEISSAQRSEEQHEAERLLRGILTDKHLSDAHPEAWDALYQLSAAPEALKALLIQHGAHPLGRAALAAHPDTALSEEERLERAEQLFSDRDYQQAKAAFLEIEGSARADLQQQAKARLGHIQLRLREDYPSAERWLLDAAEGPQERFTRIALYRLSILYGRIDQWDEAITSVRAFLDHQPRGSLAREARYQIGRLAHQAGRYDEAIRAHRRFLRRRPKDRVKYIWFLGWSHYRAGRCRAAREVWAPLLENRNTLVGPKALYWSARCALKELRPRRAMRLLRQLRRRAPLSYYGLLGEGLWQREPLSRAARPLKRPRGAPHRRVTRRASLRRARRKLRAAERSLLDAIVELVFVGEPALARPQARALCEQRSVRRSIGRRGQRKLCDQLNGWVEGFGRQWRRGSKAQRYAPWRVEFDRSPSAVGRGAYPPAYLELVRAAGSLEGVSPWWLLGHMLQESRYRERVKSWAGARGLMQILPRTGKRIADRLGFPPGPFQGHQLYAPGVAIRQGAWYLARLAEDLGHPLLAAGAYNGGPRRIGDHVRRHPDLTFDELIEELGAHESRNYMRKVADHALRYVSLYGDQESQARLFQAFQLPLRAPEPKGEILF